MKELGILLLFLCTLNSFGQSPEMEVLLVKSRLDSIEAFKADLELHVNISFISMPDKQAQAIFKKGQDMIVSSENFTLIPKRGLDLSFSELFTHKFMVVDRGPIEDQPEYILSVSILPLEDKADYSVANLYIDTQTQRIIYAQINTKKDGTYTLELSYPDDRAVLPSRLSVYFEIDRIRIPLNFAGSDVSIDRKKMRNTDQKTGEIILDLSYQNIERTE